MPAIEVSPLSIVNQIKSLLRDRYESGYPILKELVQNADDAEAHRVRLDALNGWRGADNPLLRGPGLLVVNDGVFHSKDRHGILSFGESVKATDASAIGKFGLGQKAVFHLCDAFIVHAFGPDGSTKEPQELFSTVVNPFLRVEVDGNQTDKWEKLSDGDLKLLCAAVPVDCRTRALLLWLPFRREKLRPAPDAGFSNLQPRPDGIVAELARRDDLRPLVAGLRHVESIEIRDRGRTRCAVHLLDANQRLLGPERWPAGVRSFSGTVGTKPDGTRAHFVAREATLRTERLQELHANEHWPAAISALRSTPEPEKGEPHGAATLLRVPPTATSRNADDLTISWAVFLPISEIEAEAATPRPRASEAIHQTPRIGPLAFDVGSGRIGDVSLGRLHLLLHGYFFMDSGRRHIEGLSQTATPDVPTTTAELARAWNAELRDSVVLPLIPAVLRDALEQKLIRSAELVPVAANIARHPWFRQHRRSICGEHALVRVIEPPGAVVWRLVPAGSPLRPLPGSAAHTPARLRELFNGVHALARDRNLVPCVDPEASLTAEPTFWLPDELGALFAMLSPRVFQLPALARLLGDVLAVVDPPLRSDRSDLQKTIGPHLRRALSDALNDTDSSLAPSEQIRSILSHAPRSLFLPLPKSVEHRRLLQALASARASVLPVRQEWLVDAATVGSSPVNDDQRLPRTDLAALLAAVEPIIADGEQPDLADQAAAAALQFLRRQDLWELSRLDGFADLAILRCRDPRTDGHVVLTLKESCERSRRELLFRTAPTAKTLLGKLARALPDAQPVIVSGKTAELLGEQGDATLRLVSSDKRGCLDLVDAASRFGNDTDRAELIDALQVADGDDRTALRRLCAGKPAAGMPTVQLAATDGLSPEIERIAARCVFGDESMFIVPRCIADTLSPKQRDYIGIDTFDNPGIEALFARTADALLDPRLTETERDAILQMDISDSALYALPIHVRSDGAVGNAEGVFLVEAEWPIPPSLKKHVPTVVLSDCLRARTRQETLLPRWSARTQIDTALSQSEPHTFRTEILNALERISEDLGSGAAAMRPELSGLRATRWLAVDDTPTAPGEVWRLPRPVEDAARSLFSSLDPQPAFVTVERLPVEVREHRGFRYFVDRLLPNHSTSLEALARIVEVADVAGHLGPVEHCPFEDFIVLAEAGADLALPGWRLLAALLLSARDTGVDAASFRTPFRQLSEREHHLAGPHLDALADLASREAPTAGAARRAYEHGLKAVSEWPDGSRHFVFGRTRVPTVDGQWRSGREVVLEDDRGVARTHVLDQACASILRTRNAHAVPTKTVASAGDESASPSGALAPNAAKTYGSDGAVRPVDLPAIEAESVDAHRRFLERWRGRVPSDLVIVYLGFIGRYDVMRTYARRWEAEATHDVGTLWRELDERLGRFIRERLRDRVNHRRFQITEVGGGHVPAVALSGEPFQAPLDDSSELLVGNFHKQRNVVTSGEVPQRRLLVELHLRRVDPAAQTEALRVFRRFVETVAVDCLWIGMKDERAALIDILDKASEIGQTTLEETELLLRDLLPGVLAQLKPARGSACQQALQTYQEDESWIHRKYGASDPSGPAELAKSKMALWRRLHGAGPGAELLFAVRAKIEDLGYFARSVLFELFQNADDAYVQLDAAPDDACFQVEILSDVPSGFRVVHWGRPVNHRGPNAEEGGRRGYDRDLANMLLMNFSEKRPGLTEEDPTGKFGLGFKSVHILSDSVGIASGFVALRTHGGFLPMKWPAGSQEAYSRNRPDGSKATVVEVPFAADRTAEGEECIREFRAGLMWLPVFARRIRRVEVTGVNPVNVECSSRTLAGADGIDAFTVHASAETLRALRFDLGDGYCLLLAIDEVGPCAPLDGTPRIWNLAPLAETVRPGWLLNGPFPVDPGRGRLAGSNQDRRTLFARLGRSLGERLLELYDVAANDWARFADAVGLDPSEHAARPRFWSRLFGVLRRDLDDELGRCLHVEGGYRRLAAERPVVPTGLPQPFDELVLAAEVTRRASGALTDGGVFERVRDWPGLSSQKRRVVNTEGAEVLRQLGFDGIRPITLCGLLG